MPFEMKGMILLVFVTLTVLYKVFLPFFRRRSAPKNEAFLPAIIFIHIEFSISNTTDSVDVFAVH